MFGYSAPSPVKGTEYKQHTQCLKSAGAVLSEAGTCSYEAVDLEVHLPGFAVSGRLGVPRSLFLQAGWSL